MIFNPYKIYHIDLAAGQTDVDVAGNAALYCVFWYKSIPLGDRYLAFKDPSPEKQFWNECLGAIWPALAHYHTLRKITQPLKKPLTAEPGVLRALCEEVLAEQTDTSIPATCDISVVICTRNRHASLANCLRHLQQQQCRPAEIIVIDNASATDDTRNVVEAFRDVRYIRENRPGLDIARNRGAMEARSTIVAYTDDDTIPHPLWTYSVFESFTDPTLSAMTGLVLAASLNSEAEVIFERYWAFNRGYLPKRYDSAFFNSKLRTGPPVWEIGAGANMAFRKAVFEQVGYFDERLDVGAAGCSGDSELWYRILACGLTIGYNPTAVVHHLHRNSIQELRRQLQAYMRGFTVAILIQYEKFSHRGNLVHLLKAVPLYYLTLLFKGFPRYAFQYQTLFSELRGLLGGFFYYWRHRKTDSHFF